MRCSTLPSPAAIPDDVEIRRVQTDLAEPVEVLYSDAFLVAAQWDDLGPMYTTQTPPCCNPPATAPALPGWKATQTVEGSLEAEAHDCYQLRGAAGEEITLWVEGAADLDTVITLLRPPGQPAGLG